MKSKKETRLVSNQKFTQFSEKIKERRDYYNSLYVTMLNNKKKGLEELLAILTNRFNKEFDLEFLEKEITYMSQKINSDKAHECDIIVKYALAKREGNKKDIVRYNGILQLMDAKREKNKERAMEVRNSKTYVRNRDCLNDNTSSKLDESIKIMDKVLNDEVTSNDIDKKTIYPYITELKRSLKKIDFDKYVEFIIKYYGLTKISDRELKQLREVIEYFIRGIDNNLMKIKSLDPDIESNKVLIEQIPVMGFEKLDDKVKAYPRKVYNWKLSKLENKRDLYSNYLEMVNGLLIDRNFDSYKALSSVDKKNLQEDSEFLTEYINEFKNIADVYNPYVKKVNTTTDENIAKLKLKFINSITEE